LRPFAIDFFAGFAFTGFGATMINFFDITGAAFGCFAGESLAVFSLALTLATLALSFASLIGRGWQTGPL
jgi:hypothetical protein